MDTNVIDITQKLISLPSVTPDDAGCQQYISQLLESSGFTCQSLPFGDVSNLWAVRGSGGPLVVFAGHTDVVPAGDESLWDNPPFSARLVDGYIYGRGAADMKGSIAAFLAGLTKIEQQRGTLGVLLTSDEEGPAIDGTTRVVDYLQGKGVFCDYTVIGEPSSQKQLGDCVRIGRRGSLSADINIQGKGGHVAYPEQVRNPVNLAAGAIARLADCNWEDIGGNSDKKSQFPPTSIQFTKIHSDSGAGNVVPQVLNARCNLRYNPAVTAEQIQQHFHKCLQATGLEYSINWAHSGKPFISDSGVLHKYVTEVVQQHTGISPELSTGGGTSDGRFLIQICKQLVELGPVNSTIHQYNECTNAAELQTLSDIYAGLFSKLLG